MDPRNIPAVRLPKGLGSAFSDGSSDFVSPPGPQRMGEKVTIRMRALKGAQINDVKLRIFPDGEERMVPMKPRRAGPFEYWEAEVILSVRPFPYRFRLQTADHVFWMNARGLHLAIPSDSDDFKLVPGYSGPGWVPSSVFYQIFPDRFRCGRPRQSKKPHEMSPALDPARIKEWNEPLDPVNRGNEFYGGDLWGILDRIPHLRKLNVNALYLTPIFSAPSNHKYDVASYEQVDPFFGGNEALAELSKALGEAGIRFILDGVFNHCGNHHPWLETARKNPSSPERKMFTFSENSDEYVSWLGHRNLPKLDYASGMVRDRIYLAGDSAAKRWLVPPFASSGWRLDAANMLGRGGTDEGNLDLWREFRREVKSVSPDAYLVGECFFEGTRWLQGDTFDGVMNYKGFTIPLIQWLTGRDLHLHPARIPAIHAALWISSVMAKVPFALRNTQLNSLSTHDIPRFIHRVEGNEALYRVAAAIQMAFPGTPSIYYGEEIAMEGGRDPQNRRPMDWGRVSEKAGLIEFIAHLTGLRRSLAVLRDGAFTFLPTSAETLAFARFKGAEHLIVGVNPFPEPRLIRIDCSLLGLKTGWEFSDLVGTGGIRTTGRNLILEMGPSETRWVKALSPFPGIV